MKLLSPVRLFETPWTVAPQAPPSMGFSRREYSCGLPFPSPMHESEKWKWSCSVVSTLSDPMDCSQPGSSVHGILQARVLEWGAIAFSLSLASRSQLCASLSSSMVSLYLSHGRSIYTMEIGKCLGSNHAWCQPSVPRSMLSWSQSYSLLGLTLGFVTRWLFLRKIHKIIINTGS